MFLHTGLGLLGPYWYRLHLADPREITRPLYSTYTPLSRAVWASEFKKQSVFLCELLGSWFFLVIFALYGKESISSPSDSTSGLPSDLSLPSVFSH